ncbi:hypothetical protein CDEST_14764 [Colletotrichum destructivum]|uniref:Uncharacterized protein n=1 Tax=Colletotrichum destructivum TaxID=34406 RepID=A0AAX4J344_9PEZI|nr:hypothetical protein CDEST_14764 [Colletotrichum destructivum]
MASTVKMMETSAVVNAHSKANNRDSVKADTPSWKVWYSAQSPAMPRKDASSSLAVHVPEERHAMVARVQ